MFSKFTRKAALDKEKKSSDDYRRGQMKFTDFVTKSDHTYAVCKYAPFVYSTKTGKTKQVQAFCPFSHDGARKGLEFSEDVMLKCSVHGFHIPSSLINLSEKQDKTLQIYDADKYDVDKMSPADKQKWILDFESTHGRKPHNIYSYEEHHMVLPRCKHCKTFKVGRSTTEASRGRYFFTCVGCGIKKQDFFCYLLNITKKNVRDLQYRVDTNPAEYANIITSEHVARFLKEMFTSTSSSGLTVRLNDLDDMTLEDINESVLDTSNLASSDSSSHDILENALLFIKSFFNFDNYIIITIKYFNLILESIKEKESHSNEKSFDKTISKKSVDDDNNEPEEYPSSRAHNLDADDVETVPNKRVKL